MAIDGIKTFLLAAGALVWAGAAAAGPTNDDCLTCHADPTATRADGRSVSVDKSAFDGSVHGILGCTDCHQDLATAELPHGESLARVDCATCHADAVTAYGKGIHAKARESGQTLAATCVDCHGTHDILPSKNSKSRTYPIRLPETCGRCHGDAKIIREAGIQIGDVYSQYHDSIHGRALDRSGLLVSAKCTDCHGHHEVRRKDDPESGVARAQIPSTCGKCHEGIRDLYREGIHGTRLAAGDRRVPVCSDCHTAHAIRRTDLPEWKLDVLAECGTCHPQSMKTYRDTFHGQVTDLGFVRVASCASCHGAHDIFPEADVRSRISESRRAETCGACHPGATANFAKYDPHADKHDPDRNPWLYASARFMEVLLIGVFVFFGLHTSLWFQRLLRRDKHAGAPPPAKTE